MVDIYKKNLICNKCDHLVHRVSDSGTKYSHCECPRAKELGLSDYPMSDAAETDRCAGFTPFVPRLL